MSTFVSVGNLKKPFTRLLNEVERLACNGSLSMPVLVQAGHTLYSSQVCRVFPFCDMGTFETYIAESDDLILHAGAGSIISALRAGKHPVVVPRRVKYDEHIDDHQVQIADSFSVRAQIFVVHEITALDAVLAQARLSNIDSTAALRHSSLLQLVGADLEAIARRAKHR